MIKNKFYKETLVKGKVLKFKVDRNINYAVVALYLPVKEDNEEKSIPIGVRNIILTKELTREIAKNKKTLLDVILVKVPTANNPENLMIKEMRISSVTKYTKEQILEEIKLEEVKTNVINRIIKFNKDVTVENVDLDKWLDSIEIAKNVVLLVDDISARNDFTVTGCKKFVKDIDTFITYLMGKLASRMDLDYKKLLNEIIDELLHLQIRILEVTTKITKSHNEETTK